MKVEIILQITNLILTFFIGVIVAIYLGQFNYRKRRKEDLINELIKLNQSISDFIYWHSSINDKYIFFKLISKLNQIENDFENPPERRNLMIVFESIYLNIIKTKTNEQIIDNNLQVNYIHFVYSGNNPLFNNRLFLLKLSKRERKMINSSYEELNIKLTNIKENFSQAKELIDREYSKEVDIMISETKEILMNYGDGHISLETTTNKIIDKIGHLKAKIINDNKKIFLTDFTIYTHSKKYETIIMNL